MLVRDVMQRDVLTADEDSDLEQTLQNMLSHGVRHVPILRGAQVVGVLSERNVLGHKARGARTGKVGDAMVPEPYVTDQESSIASAAALMSVHKIGCLPVVDRGQLVGIVTLTDMVTQLAQEEVPERDVRVLRAKDVMRVELAVAHPDDNLLDASQRMIASAVRHLPVVDGQRRLIGMLSDRDVRSRVGAARMSLAPSSVRERLEAVRVRHAMTRNPYSVTRDSLLKDVGRLLADDRIGALAVVDAEEHVVGMISYVDMLRTLVGGIPAEANEARA